MAYLRKPGGEKRGKCHSSEEDTTQKSKKQHHVMPASPSFTPLEQGEDKASYERHMKNLQQECKNVHPDKQVKALYTAICLYVYNSMLLDMVKSCTCYYSKLVTNHVVMYTFGCTHSHVLFTLHIVYVLLCYSYADIHMHMQR